MSVVSDGTLYDACTNYRLDNPIIEPFNPDNLSGASYDVSLGTEISEYEQGGIITLANDVNKLLIKREPPYYLMPGGFCLAITREIFVVPATMAMAVWGKSRNGRKGLQIHNAGWADPGFRGRLVLELFNQGPFTINLQEGDLIAQVAFHYLDETAQSPYGSDHHYQNQWGIRA